jgi:hypothetical protein
MSEPKKYRAAVQGSVAVIFGIMAAVVFGAAGMALDFINASNVRTSLQHALDGAVLAAASAHVKNEHEAETIITEFMTSNWTEKYPTLDTEIKQSVDDDVVTGTASVQLPTLMTGLLGFYNMDIAVTSSATPQHADHRSGDGHRQFNLDETTSQTIAEGAHVRRRDACPGRNGSGRDFLCDPIFKLCEHRS